MSVANDRFQEGSMSASRFVASGAGRLATEDSRTLMQRVRKGIALAWRRHKTRRMLTEMDERMLSDLGISRAQASFEASRWMWD